MVWKQDVHRPGSLKQQNKPHKHGSHRSKGALQALNKGKVSVKEITAKAKHEMSKQERRHQATQLRKNKRAELSLKKRSVGSATSPPHVVAIISFCLDENGEDVLETLKTCDEMANITQSNLDHVHISCPRLKMRCSFLTPQTGDVYAALDAAKVSDTVIVVLSVGGLGTYGDYLFHLLFAQGLPTCLITVRGMAAVPQKKRSALTKDVRKSLGSWLPDARLHNIDSDIDGQVVLRQIASQKIKSLKSKVKRVPKGTSEYQAAWILDSDADEESGDEDNESQQDEMDCAAVSHSDSDGDDGSLADEEEEYETITMSESGDTGRYDEKMDLKEEMSMLAKYKEEKVERQFPDEVDTPFDVAAKQRFARYRGLKSFRSSPWDPKENLPVDYARIFQFENFVNTKKRIMAAAKDSEEGALPGWYVTVHVKNVPRSFMEELSDMGNGRPLVMYGLLPHEHKMSVLHFVVKRYQMNEEPIRSKEPLIFQCGFRRFSACPIFSQHTTGQKHKFERFMPPGVCVATVYAPITFPPASVLVFKANSNGEQQQQQLIASGPLLSTNPDRIIVKRVVLSGHAFKINRRLATVRYMFFNREDILWFKPLELSTKYGRRGHIKDALGTHGHMKCVFDKQLTSQDTVLMKLYKRVYPKWTYDPRVRTPKIIVSDDLDDGEEEEEIME